MSTLKGEARDVIVPLEASENYVEAWELLKARYKGDKTEAYKGVIRITIGPTKEDHVALRRLDMAMKHLHALKTVKRLTEPLGRFDNALADELVGSKKKPSKWLLSRGRMLHSMI